MERRRSTEISGILEIDGARQNIYARDNEGIWRIDLRQSDRRVWVRRVMERKYNRRQQAERRRPWKLDRNGEDTCYQTHDPKFNSDRYRRFIRSRTTERERRHE